MREAAMLPELPLRAGHLTIAELIDLYMAHYEGRDTTRVQRLSWWVERLGGIRLDEVSDDHIHAAQEALAARTARYWAGTDADGKTIFRGKGKPMSPATVNRYGSAIAAVFTWSVRRRIAPKGWDHPCRRVERRPENNQKTRFLSDEERERLLAAAKTSKWPRLYLLVLLALTTGARKGELLALRWADVDLVQRVVHIVRTKNDDPKVLPLVPAVAAELERLQGAPTTLVFPSARRAGQAFAIEQRWSEALHAAQVKGFRFHDLRHSAASFLAKHGATLLEIGDLLGHRQISMTRRYAHLASTHRSALVNRVFGAIR